MRDAVEDALRERLGGFGGGGALRELLGRLLQLFGQGLRLLELLLELLGLQLKLVDQLNVPGRCLRRRSSCGAGSVGQQGDRGRREEKYSQRDEVLGTRNR